MMWRLLIGLLAISSATTGQFGQIDSLLKLLVQKTDTGRVDCLNELGYLYCIANTEAAAARCAGAGYQLATQHHYQHGIAEALYNQALIEQHFHNNFIKAAALGKTALAVYQLTSNQTNLSRLYISLAFVSFAQSKFDEALDYARKSGEISNTKGKQADMQEAESIQAVIYLQQGDYKKAFELNRQILAKAIRNHDTVIIRSLPTAFGEICMKIGDYGQALRYFRTYYDQLTAEDLRFQSMNEFDVWSVMEFAEIFTHLGIYDSALYRYQAFDSTHAAEKDLRVFLVSKGEYFLVQKKFETALPYFLRGLELHTSRNDRNEMMRTQLDIANTYLGLHQEQLAFQYAQQGLVIARAVNAKAVLRDAYEVLYTVYNHRKQLDSAYHYYRNYITAKDSVTADQTKGALAAYNYEQQIDLLSKEKLIGRQQLRIEQQKLRNESLLRNILLLFALTLLIVSVLIIRNILLKRKNEALRNDQLQAGLKHNATELEMQALRAQMNPHFIFNCLNSINRFILKNESEAASSYLTQFSRLIRMVLTNSRKSYISLEEEVNMLTLYMDMEKLRFKDAFSYQFEFDPDVDVQGTVVPPLLIQPFVENAIWHGLMHKKENGLVVIAFNLQYNTLVCTITDNGAGRSHNGAGKTKDPANQPSMGIQITRDRLNLINNAVAAERVSFEIEDLHGADGLASGTKVTLKMNTN